MLDAMARLVLVGDAAPQEMADVRRKRIDLAFLTVETEREEFAVRQPEVAVEALLQVLGLAFEFARPFRVAPDEARQPRGAALGVIDIPLKFAGGARGFRQRAVREGD